MPESVNSEFPSVNIPLELTERAWTTGHEVQFYDTEDFLYPSVAGFLVEGFRAGQPFIVIATEQHRRAILTQMRIMGVHVDDLVHGRDAVWIDAHDALAAFMEGAMPNRDLFEATVGNVFAKLMASRRYLVVRAYGEMVDILWRDGNIDGAIVLEELWNALGEKYAFSLRCAYSDCSGLQKHGHGFHEICARHSRVHSIEKSSAA